MNNIENIECNNLKEILYESVKNYENNIAFTIKKNNNEYVNISYKAFLEDINKLGTALYNMNLKEKRIAIIGRNSYEWALAHMTNMLGGMISIPLDKDLQCGELESLLLRSEPTAIVFDSKYIDKIEEVKNNPNIQIKEYISMEKLDGYISIQELLLKGEKLLKDNKEFVDYKVKSDIMSILLFTSGTTEQAKAVMLSQKGIAANIYAMRCVEDIRSTDTNIAFLPYHHIFGSTCMIMMLACGAKTVFPDGLKYIKQNLNEYKVSIFVGVPVLIEAIYHTIYKEIKKQKKENLINMLFKVSNFLYKHNIDIRRKLFKAVIDQLGGELRFLISGGAPADKEVSQKFNDMGITIVQGYGLSETSPVIAAEYHGMMRNGSVGKPLNNVKVDIVDKDKDGIGEVIVKGPNVMLGYYQMPEKTAEVIKDGWFYTGDLGYIDKDGFLFITGRRKNLIVLKNGKKVFPEEMEIVVNRLDIVEESMVFGLPDKNDKNDVMVSVKISYNKDVRENEYSNLSDEEFYNEVWKQIKELNKTFPRYKHIQKMILTGEELIKTTTKKIKRFEEIKLIEKEIQ
ncbi:MAG: AMP-binding protein [Clostridia bacterium]|nr:AMP-binding protein [Clostridia bacterium]